MMGTYRVNETGTGSGIFNITTTSETGIPPHGLSLLEVTQETFSSVIGEGTIEFMGISLIDSSTRQPVAAIVVGGVLKAQSQ